MAETYTFQAQGPSIEKEPVVCILNKGTRAYQISSLRMEPRFNYKAPPTSNPRLTLSTARISAYDVGAGVQVDFAPLQSDSANINSSIKIIVNPSYITISGLFCNTPNGDGILTFNTTSGLSSLLIPWAPTMSGRLGGTTFGDMVRACRKGQPLTLAQGEGVAFYATSADSLSTNRRVFQVTVSVSGETYTALVNAGSPAMTNVVFCLFNSAGSGLSCQVLDVSELPGQYGAGRNLHTSPTYGQPGIPQLTITRLPKTATYDYSGKGHVTFPVVAANSGGAGTSELVVFAGNALRVNTIMVFGETLRFMEEAGIDPVSSNAAYMRAFGQTDTFRSFSPKTQYFRGDTVSSGVTFDLMKRGLLWESKKVGLCLLPGEGLMVRSLGSERYDCVIAGEISVIQAASFPAVGDVDQGVQYGPTGADYTGTLEQPAEADVESGVSYGAGGTEFTGTYVGGGGGNTYSRGRVVNS